MGDWVQTRDGSAVIHFQRIGIGKQREMGVHPGGSKLCMSG